MNLTERIQSRKFILALAACGYFALTGEVKFSFPAITQVVVAYLAVQAAQDAIADWQANRVTAAPAEAPIPPAPEVTDPGEASGWAGSVI